MLHNTQDDSWVRFLISVTLRGVFFGDDGCVEFVHFYPGTTSCNIAYNCQNDHFVSYFPKLLDLDMYIHVYKMTGMVWLLLLRQ